MNTLFEQNMDMEQPDMFHPYTVPGKFYDSVENVLHGMRWESPDMDFLFNKYYQIRLEDGRIQYLEVWDLHKSIGYAHINIDMFESEEQLKLGNISSQTIFRENFSVIDNTSHIEPDKHIIDTNHDPEVIKEALRTKCVYLLPDNMIEEITKDIVHIMRNNYDYDI